MLSTNMTDDAISKGDKPTIKIEGKTQGTPLQLQPPKKEHPGRKS
jgi:hypothetical protein